MKTKIVKEWKTKAGYKAIIIKNTNLNKFCLESQLIRNSWYCGYVGINKKHPLYGKNHHEDCKKLRKILKKIMNEPIGKRGVIPLFLWDGESASMDIVFDVHGGVTFSGYLKKSKPRSTLYYIGFDCAHADDNMKKNNIRYVTKECEHLASQLKEVEQCRK